MLTKGRKSAHKEAHLYRQVEPSGARKDGVNQCKDPPKVPSPQHPDPGPPAYRNHRIQSLPAAL